MQAAPVPIIRGGHVARIFGRKYGNEHCCFAVVKGKSNDLKVLSNVNEPDSQDDVEVLLNGDTPWDSFGFAHSYARHDRE
jgi:hypothetical protein